ncbi:hypothetical protein AB1Y20_010188 [Prymnesium parvum]|uniref:Uncharacterized protein n=1 Tax=Prymnesium parvum TaxID=97485 RepID=A0AB34K858_PRYPA
MIRPSTGCGSAWSAVRAWYDGLAVPDATCDRDVDELLALCIDAERARALETRRQSTTVGAAGGPQPSLRASSVVSEEVGLQLHREREPNVKEMEAYFRRAAAVPPEVQRAKTLDCGGEAVELARFVLKE